MLEGWGRKAFPSYTGRGEQRGVSKNWQCDTFSVSHIPRQGGESDNFSVKSLGDFGVKSEEKGCGEQETVRARDMQDDGAELKGFSLEALSLQCLSLGGLGLLS